VPLSLLYLGDGSSHCQAAHLFLGNGDGREGWRGVGRVLYIVISDDSHVE